MNPLATPRAWLAWLHEAPRHRIGVRVLQVAIGAMLWFRVATEWRYASYFWGPEGLGYGSSAAHLGPTLGRWADALFRSELGTRAVLVAELLAAVALVSGKATRLATAVALTCALLLEWRLPELCDGGDNVTRLLLIYMLLLLPASRAGAPRSISTWLHNLGVVAIVAQVVVVYITAGLMKASGAKWTNGTAMYIVSQIEWFSLPSMRRAFKSPWVVTLSTYGTIFFQLWFPFAIFSRLKVLWLAIGVSLHLGIAVFMGLIPFSLVMIGLELAVLSDDEYRRGAALLRSAAERAGRLLPRRHRRAPEVVT